MVLQQRRRVPQSLKKEAAVRMSLRWVNLINSSSLISLTSCTIVKQLLRDCLCIGPELFPQFAFTPSSVLMYYSFCPQHKKRSAVEGLIEIENPNRVSNRSKKATEVDLNATTVLSRRERWGGDTPAGGISASFATIGAKRSNPQMNIWSCSHVVWYLCCISPSGRR